MQLALDQLSDRLIDSRECGVPSQNLERLKQRRGVFSPTNSHANWLEHLSRLYAQFLSCGAESLIQWIVFEFSHF